MRRNRRDRGLRIAVIAPSRFPIRQPFPGGLEAFVWLLSRSLRRQGHHVTLFAARGSDPHLADCVRVFPDLAHIDQGRLDQSHDPRLIAAEHRNYLSLMSRLGADSDDGFDVIHNNSLHYLPLALAHQACAPVVTTLHTPPIPLMQLALQTRAVSNTSRHDRSIPSPTVTAVSHHTAASWPTQRADIIVIPNGIDVQDWRPGPGGGPLIWFGRIVDEKGVEFAIAAARQCGRTLEIAGPIGDPAYFERAVAPHLGQHVRYLGHLTQSELARAVGRASVSVVTPVWDEPFGLVVTESMACGTPVAAFGRGGIPEIITARTGRLAPAGDVDALAAAIREAAGLSRQQVRAHAVEGYSAALMVARYEQLYRRMISVPAELVAG